MRVCGKMLKCGYSLGFPHSIFFGFSTLLFLSLRSLILPAFPELYLGRARALSSVPAVRRHLAGLNAVGGLG